MILRRLADSIRRQDWFVVLLEIFIVVVGVFIGIEVANWNEARQAQQEEVKVFARLVTEAEQARVALTDYRDYHVNNAAQTVELVKLMQDELRCADFDGAREKHLLISVGDFPAPRFSLATAQELASSERLSLVQASEMQDAIREIVVEVEHVSELWRRYLRIKQDAEAVYLAAGISQNRPIVDDIGKLDDSYGAILDAFEFATPERLCGNSALIAIASNASLSQSFYAAYLDGFAETLDVYSERLETYAASRWSQTRLNEASP